MREVLTPNPAWGRRVAWLERPHTHVCQQCGWTYEGQWVESGWPHAGDCCCSEERLCEKCEKEASHDRS